jgi:hypothetical protein
MNHLFTPDEVSDILSVKETIEKKCSELIDESWWTTKLPWEQTVLTGGAIASLIQGEIPKDWDVYFLSQKANQIFTQHLMMYTDYIADVSENYINHVGQNGKMITGNSITMKNGFSFITMMHGDIATLRKDFDFLHCTPYFHNNKLYISKKQYLAAKHKVLIQNNPANKVNLWRVEKFISRGYTKGVGM